VALNLAITQSRGPLLAFTDDDCVVSPQWLERLVAHFQQNPQVGEICGTVLAAEHDPALGHIPASGVLRNVRVTTSWFSWRVRVMGANMAFRRTSLQAVGPFDEMLGPGTTLLGGEDWDLSHRILKAGYSVINVPDAVVIHSGFRTYEQSRAEVRKTFESIGALYMKHLRLGDIAVVPAILNVWIFGCISWKRLLLLRKRNGLGRFAYFGSGLIVSFRYAIDRRRRVYLATSSR
jgi:GT2 family glycosyltransferase